MSTRHVVEVGETRLPRGLVTSFLIYGIFVAYAVFSTSPLGAYSANKIWFEFRPQGIYRVYVQYTVPELKEFREVYVEFRKKKEAEKFYYDLLRGADFFPPAPGLRQFTPPQLKPEPW